MLPPASRDQRSCSWLSDPKKKPCLYTCMHTFATLSKLQIQWLLEQWHQSKMHTLKEKCPFYNINRRTFNLFSKEITCEKWCWKLWFIRTHVSAKGQNCCSLIGLRETIQASDMSSCPFFIFYLHQVWGGFRISLACVSVIIWLK